MSIMGQQTEVGSYLVLLSGLYDLVSCSSGYSLVLRSVFVVYVHVIIRCCTTIPYTNDMKIHKCVGDTVVYDCSLLGIYLSIALCSLLRYCASSTLVALFISILLLL